MGAVMKSMKAMKGLKAMAGMKAMAAMKAMKAMKAKPRAADKALSKGGIADALAAASEVKKSDCSKILDALADMGTKQVKGVGKFVISGLVMIKTRRKAATKAGKRVMFGKEVVVAAKPAKTVVKAFPVSALKKSV